MNDAQTQGINVCYAITNQKQFLCNQRREKTDYFFKFLLSHRKEKKKLFQFKNEEKNIFIFQEVRKSEKNMQILIIFKPKCWKLLKFMHLTRRKKIRIRVFFLTKRERKERKRKKLYRQTRNAAFENENQIT